MSTINTLTPAQFRQCQLNADYCVIDVRDINEFAADCEDGSCNWPLSEIDAASAASFAAERGLQPNQTLVLLCARGMRAQMAAEKLAKLLPNPIAVVSGGRAALAPTGGPISIERQVRIATGSLVLLGAIGSLIIHPALLAISCFIGAGLLFAGITDWCGMGLLMRKMPWNNRA